MAIDANPADSFPDPNLVIRAQRGDQSALAILYEAFFNRIYRYILARIGNVAEAEDLTEEVFLRMLRGLTSFESQDEGPTQGFSSWLFRIAHNLIIDRVRTETYRGGRLALLDAEPSETEQIGAALERQWERQELDQAIRRLTDDQRDVVTLRFAAELSLAETATVLGKQIGNVKVLQHHALVNLRRILTEQPPPSSDRGRRPTIAEAWGQTS